MGIIVFLQSSHEALQNACSWHVDVPIKCKLFDANPDANGQKAP